MFQRFLSGGNAPPLSEDEKNSRRGNVMFLVLCLLWLLFDLFFFLYRMAKKGHQLCQVGHQRDFNLHDLAPPRIQRHPAGWMPDWGAHDGIVWFWWREWPCWLVSDQVLLYNFVVTSTVLWSHRTANEVQRYCNYSCFGAQRWCQL